MHDVTRLGIGTALAVAVGLAACGGSSTEGAPAPDAGTDGVAPLGPLSFPSRLGAHFDDTGRAVRFRVRSTRATRIEVALYAVAMGEGARLERPLEREAEGSDVWSLVVPLDELRARGVAGTVYYGYRAWGPNWPYTPTYTRGSADGFVADVDADGNRFDPNKLLLDPYALEMSHDPHGLGRPGGAEYSTGNAGRAVDTGPFAPKGIVLSREDEAPSATPRPDRPLADEVIYEVHVRGFTKADPSVPEAERGTYAGAARKAAYLKELGVTAIELLPIHETQNDQNDAASSSAGMNYWGYSTLSFFAPDRRYAADKSPGGPTRELRAMVAAMHAAGIKVLIDVVYNHTGEGGLSKAAPGTARLLSFRGLDNAAYYELTNDQQLGVDNTGTSGNFQAASPLVRDLVLDSLNWYADSLGVDGFRFDLAPILGNTCARGCFRYDAAEADNILNRAAREVRAHLIAEPWGIGAGTYQMGRFPPGWSEWNDAFRDTIRKAQNELGTTTVTPGELISALRGSPDHFGDDGRPPAASVNFVVAHDGFTLRDLYSYNKKKNDQPWPYGPSSGGSDNNHSWDNRGDAALQTQQARSAVALLAVSAGVPMITGGDEFLRTQYGNNNTFNLDSDKNWLDWSTLPAQADFLAFTRGALAFRAAHPALRPSAYPRGKDGNGNGVPDFTPLTADGKPADAAYLGDGANHFVALRIDGTELGDPAASIWVGYNAWNLAIAATLPPAGGGRAWRVVGDSARGAFAEPGTELPAPARVTVEGRSVVVAVER